eukprot:7589498-Pyramimonas_sp.AAC.1
MEEYARITLSSPSPGMPLPLSAENEIDLRHSNGVAWDWRHLVRMSSSLFLRPVLSSASIAAGPNPASPQM